MLRRVSFPLWEEGKHAAQSVLPSPAVLSRLRRVLPSPMVLSRLRREVSSLAIPVSLLVDVVHSLCNTAFCSGITAPFYPFHCWVLMSVSRSITRFTVGR